MTISSFDTFKMYMKMFLAEQKLQVKKLHPDAILPTRGTSVAAGLDIYALESGALRAEEHCVVGTGLAIALPPGFEGQVRPRSGLAAKFSVTVVNSPGTIDEDYRGELKVLLINHGFDTFTWKAGDRIAQLIITQVTYANVEEVQELSATLRGANGFGSTGR